MGCLTRIWNYKEIDIEDAIKIVWENEAEAFSSTIHITSADWKKEEKKEAIDSSKGIAEAEKAIGIIRRYLEAVKKNSKEGWAWSPGNVAYITVTVYEAESGLQAQVEQVGKELKVILEKMNLIRGYIIASDLAGVYIKTGKIDLYNIVEGTIEGTVTGYSVEMIKEIEERLNYIKGELNLLKGALPALDQYNNPLKSIEGSIRWLRASS